MTATRGALVVGIAAVFLVGKARADDDPDTEIAQRHFHAAGKLYEAKDYEKALEEFRAARAIRALPELDFDIARCLDRMERVDEAIATYQAYLQERPDAPDAGEVRERIAVLQARVAARPPKTPPPATPPTPAAAQPPQEPPKETAPPKKILWDRMGARASLGLGVRELYTIPLVGADFDFALGGYGRRGAWWLDTNVLVGRTGSLTSAHFEIGFAGEWFFGSRVRLGLTEGLGAIMVQRITDSSLISSLTISVHATGSVDLYKTGNGIILFLGARFGVMWPFGLATGSIDGDLALGLRH